MTVPVPVVPRPEQSVAVLIGSSSYTRLAPLVTVTNNVRVLERLFTDEKVWGLPEGRCVSVIDPETPDDFLNPVVEAARAATSCLVVYFAGHGYRAADGSLCLALRHSDGLQAYTGVPYDWLVGAIKQHRPQATIVILDCCYSGLAATAMDGTDGTRAAAEEFAAEAQAATSEGVYIMASAAKDRRSLAPTEELYTAFTGEIADMLEQGLPGAGPVLSVDTIFATAQHRLRARQRPVPVARSANTANTVGFRNQNDTGVAAPVVATPAPATTVAAGFSSPRAVTATIPHWRAPSLAESPFQLRLQAAASALSMEAARRVVDHLSETGVADDRLAVEWTTAPERLMGNWADIRRRHRRTDDPRHSRLHRASPST